MIVKKEKVKFPKVTITIETVAELEELREGLGGLGTCSELYQKLDKIWKEL